jgi:N-acetylglucosamine-6-sulfatase
VKLFARNLLASLCAVALSALALAFVSPLSAAEPMPKALPQLEKVAGAQPRNIVFILCDDHRYDALGCLGHPFLETPHLDSLAKNGAIMRNAFVTTSLCSPSRASILTGLYAHRHGVVDNYNPVSPALFFFPQYLQQAGYTTGFFGKWHMGGEVDDPQRGWNHWVSFKGQGNYWADLRGSTRVVAQTSTTGFNVNGKHVEQKGYITDELTDYAVDWLKSLPADKPFMMYLSHKAVHSDFVPADRYKDRYKDKAVPRPKTQDYDPENKGDKPMWVRNQRNSWHGADFAYHSDLDIAAYYRRYCETLLAVDDSVGRVLDTLKDKGVLDSTLVIYMGDNGFMFGEHGLIDKRCAYEASIRVPMLMQCPELFPGGKNVEQVVANIDIAPTILHAAGLKPPAYMDGRSFLDLAQGKPEDWRDGLLYEYYWERNYPETPTMHALRGDRYKYVRYTGLWDIDELYDLKNDPEETQNLIHRPDLQPLVAQLNARLFEVLDETGGMQIPLLPDRGVQHNLRRRGGAPQAKFPEYLMRNKSDKE